MGWTFRRRIKLGPINLNFSRSGMGLSAGAGPFRAGVDAKGRHYSNVRGPFGIYNRQYYTPGTIQQQTVQTLNNGAAKDSFVALLFSAGALIVSSSGALTPETQAWLSLFALFTGIPGILGLVGYFAHKDASTGWFQIVALIVKAEKWLLVGLVLTLILAAASNGKKRR